MSIFFYAGAHLRARHALPDQISQFLADAT
jgi:hypothetical protein